MGLSWIVRMRVSKINGPMREPPAQDGSGGRKAAMLNGAVGRKFGVNRHEKDRDPTSLNSLQNVAPTTPALRRLYEVLPPSP